MAFSRSYPSASGTRPDAGAASRAPIRASMYFAFGADARPGIKSRTTFDAILAGERTSTTRFRAWPGYDRWAAAQPGDLVRFFADKEMRGRFVDVEIERVELIDLANCSAEQSEAWSKAEGWSTAHGRQLGRKYGPGLQVRYRAL